MGSSTHPTMSGFNSTLALLENKAEGIVKRRLSAALGGLGAGCAAGFRVGLAPEAIVSANKPCDGLGKAEQSR